MLPGRRGVTPVIGVVLMVVLTLLLASIIASGVATFGDGLDEKKRQYDEAVSTVTTMAANPWSGEPGDLFRLSDTTAGATDVTYRMNFTIEPGSVTIGNSLDSIYMEVTTGSPDMFSNTDQSDVVKVVVDEGSDGTVDHDLTDNVDGWQVLNGGTALEIGFTGLQYAPDADDSIIVVFEGVDNPQTAGSYDMRAQTNDDGNWHYGTIEITD